MKTSVKLFGVVAGMAALFASCNKQEDIVAPESKTVEMTIVAGSDDTKTVLGAYGAVTWSEAGEKLQVIETAGTNISSKQSSEGTTTDGGKTMSFPVSLTASTETSFSYNAVYPYSALVEKPSELAKAKITLASTQYPTASSFGPAADILISKTVDGLTEQPTELNLQFARVIAIGKMTIKNLNTTENVKKVTFTAAGKPVTGRSYINLTTATAPEGYGYYPTDNVVLDYSGKEILANEMTAYFTCWPFSIAAGESFSVVVETENYTFTKDVPLAEGKSLAFNAGRASAFNVNFDGIAGVEKAPVTQLVPDGTYVVAYDKYMMAVGTTSNKYRDAVSLPEAPNTDGSYSVDATAAWNFVYNSKTDTYQINSASDNTLYIQGSSTASDFKLVAKESATSFTITKDEEVGTYRIANTRCIGYNYNNGTNPRFAMYATTSTNQYIDLNLYTAKVPKLAEITVQETLDLSADLAESSFPVSWKNVDLPYTSVDVYQDEACTIVEKTWISVEFNEDKSAILYTVLNNDTDAERKAYIKVEAISVDGASEDSKVIVVTQAKAVPLTAYPYSESFAESKGEFTIDNVSLPSALTYVWLHSTYNNEGYMKASAFKSSKNYAAESWLISPVIDMSSAVNPVLSFMTVARYGSNENLTLWAREKGGDWAQLSFSNYGTGKDWDFVSNTVDLSAYAGKTLQFAYKYVSTDTGASTWEIKNVEVKEQTTGTESGSTSYSINATDACFSADENAYQSKEKSFTANDGSVWLFNGYSVSVGTSFAIGKGGANYITTPSSSNNIKSITVKVKGNTSYYLTVKTSDGNTELLSTKYTNNSEFYEYTFDLSSLEKKYTQVRLVSRRSSGTSNAAGTFESITVTYE